MCDQVNGLGGWLHCEEQALRSILWFFRFSFLFFSSVLVWQHLFSVFTRTVQRVT